MRILVVEDETDLGVAVAEHLRAAARTVDFVGTVEVSDVSANGTV